jgi:hypothetical protein
VGNTRATKADIIYSFMDGEGWDFLGSKMLAQDLKSFECKVQDEDKPNRCRNPPRSSTRFTKLGLDRIIAFFDLGQLATTGMLIIFIFNVQEMDRRVCMAIWAPNQRQIENWSRCWLATRRRI